jgi:glutaredoxin
MDRSLEFLRGHRLAVYSSHGCPDCTRLKQWMQRRGVAADEIYIDEDPVAAEKLESETGKQAVPFILIDGQSWVRGYHLESRARFDEAALLSELEAAISAPGSAPAR